MGDLNLLSSTPLCRGECYVVWRDGEDLYFFEEPKNRIETLWAYLPKKSCAKCKNRFLCLSRKPTKTYKLKQSMLCLK
jgi:hypothetical protein